MHSDVLPVFLVLLTHVAAPLLMLVHISPLTHIGFYKRFFPLFFEVTAVRAG